MFDYKSINWNEDDWKVEKEELEIWSAPDLIAFLEMEHVNKRKDYIEA